MVTMLHVKVKYTDRTKDCNGVDVMVDDRVVDVQVSLNALHLSS